MGPSGCGKSTVGRILSEMADIPFIEGDDYHPPANRQKMAGGSPLTDEDRKAWVDALVGESVRRPASRLVLACSALTTYVQDRLRSESKRNVLFVLLDAERGELVRRLEERENHFMPASLADSQLEALEAPEDALRVDASDDPRAIARAIAWKLED
ncbi:gluconokinase [Qipengyuania flava]|uniref:gluconokinase n=1 Tax=Qipengyuania flava TaxID=192812 RepID=UPI001C6371C7|nr:gluconokinase [Qipengyuania flava]